MAKRGRKSSKNNKRNAPRERIAKNPEVHPSAPKHAEIHGEVVELREKVLKNAESIESSSSRPELVHVPILLPGHKSLSIENYHKSIFLKTYTLEEAEVIYANNPSPYSHIAPVDVQEVAEMQMAIQALLKASDILGKPDDFKRFLVSVEALRREILMKWLRKAGHEIDQELLKAHNNMMSGKRLDVLPMITANFNVTQSICDFYIKHFRSGVVSIQEYFESSVPELVGLAFANVMPDSPLHQKKEEYITSATEYIKKLTKESFKIIIPSSGASSIKDIDLLSSVERKLGAKIMKNNEGILPVLTNEERQRYLELTTQKKVESEGQALPEYLNPDGSTSVVIQEWKDGKLPCLMMTEEEYQKSHQDKDRIMIRPIGRADYEKYQEEWDELMKEISHLDGERLQQFFQIFELASFIHSNIFTRTLQSYIGSASDEVRTAILRDSRELLAGKRALDSCISAEIHLQTLREALKIWKRGRKTLKKMVYELAKRNKAIMQLHLKATPAYVGIDHQAFLTLSRQFSSKSIVEDLIKMKNRYILGQESPLGSFKTVIDTIGLDSLFSLNHKSPDQRSRLQILVPELEAEVYGSRKQEGAVVERSSNDPLINRSNPDILQLVLENGKKYDVPLEKAPLLIKKMLERNLEDGGKSTHQIRALILMALRQRHLLRHKNQSSNPDHE